MIDIEGVEWGEKKEEKRNFVLPQKVFGEWQSRENGRAKDREREEERE